MKKPVLSIIEDIEEIRNYYLEYFQAQDEFKGVYAYENIESFLASFYEHPLPDVILSDTHLPGINGIDVIKKIKTASPEIDIIMLTVISSSEKIFKSICAGATGYVMKDIPLPDLKKAVLDVQSGGSYMSPSIARKVLEYFEPGKDISDPLSPKEKQIVMGLIDGHSHKMIAEAILSPSDNVKSYVKDIYRKLHANAVLN